MGIECMGTGNSVGKGYLHNWEFSRIPRNSQKTGDSVRKGYLHNWEFLRIPRNSQKAGNSVRKGVTLESLRTLYKSQ